MPEYRNNFTEITEDDRNDLNGRLGDSEGDKAVRTASQPHDRGYKMVLKNRRVLLHMLRKYTDFDWVHDVREEDIEFENTEFVTDKFRTYESDLVCRIRRGQQEIYLFLLMELQSGMDFTMPFRLLVYMVDIWEQYFRNVPEEKRERKEFRLPAVVPVVLYNGKGNWTAQREFRDYLKDGESFGAYGLSFRYALIDVRRLAKELVLDSNTVIDNIFYLDSVRDDRDFLRLTESVMDRVGELPPDEKNLMEVWFAHVLEGMFGEKERNFIQECFERGEKRMISGFEQMMIEKEELAEKRGKQQGIQQGIQILIESCRELCQPKEEAARLLVRKYGLAPEKAAILVEKYW